MSSDTISEPPTSPYTPNTVRKKRQNLISNLLEDFKEESYSHLYTSNINLENFEVVQVIGRGSYAKVYLIKKYHESDPELVCYYALKVLKKKFLYEKNQLHYTMHERKILLELDHPFIIKLHYAF